MSREAFEQQIIKSTNKKFNSPEYAIKRKENPSGGLGDYVKYETKVAWKWYCIGVGNK